MRIGLLMMALAILVGVLPGGTAYAEEAAATTGPASIVAEQQIADASQTGTLIFSRGDCLAVRIYTGSGYTHVAMMVYEKGHPYVYDSMNGAGVRRLSLHQYLEAQAPDEVSLFHPARAMTDDEVAGLTQTLKQQLGRPYSVKHHLTGKRCEGLHCAEYVTDSLMAIDWLSAENPVRVSPASLVTGITRYHVYEPGALISVSIQPDPASIEPESGWCGRMWSGTKQCTIGCCHQFSRWFLCH